ncbi:hypothetical protein AAG570_004868 [Ranatra chinensis]|uniref:Uncharacterized protein n=1 Tax=Ranatra chinensis TaxID=642074 RepID=A0ABD0XYT3_9HEMI
MSYVGDDEDTCGPLCVSGARAALHVVAVTCYQGLEGACHRCASGDGKATLEDPGALMFLWAAAVCLTTVPLTPKNLCLAKPYKYIYDLIAVLVLTNFLLNCIWTEVVTFLKLMDAVACEFFMELDLSRAIKSMTDIDTAITSADVVGFLLFVWVLHGAGAFGSVIKLFTRNINEFQCDLAEATASRRRPLMSAPQSKRRNYRR